MCTQQTLVRGCQGASVRTKLGVTVLAKLERVLETAVERQVGERARGREWRGKVASELRPCERTHTSRIVDTRGCQLEGALGASRPQSRHETR